MITPETRPTSLSQELRNQNLSSLEELTSLQLVSQLDPLGINNRVGLLSQVTNDRDLVDLKTLVIQILPAPDQVAKYSQPQALAALRDLGMIGAICKRWHIEPQEFIPQFGPTLVALGQVADTVPRETVYSYALWNPRGEDERRFTTTYEEGVFIESVRVWLEQLHLCLSALETLRISDWTEPQAIASARNLVTHFTTMVDAMVRVRQELPAVFFYSTLQPFFFPYKVGDRDYEAPSGAHMSLLLLDQILWGNNCHSDTYNTYVEHNLEYLPTPYQNFLEALSDSHTFFDRVSAINSQVLNPTQQNQVREILLSIKEVMNKIVSMRRIHFTIAKEQEVIKVTEGQEAKLTGDDILSTLLRESAMFRDQITSKLNEFSS